MIIRKSLLICIFFITLLISNLAYGLDVIESAKPAINSYFEKIEAELDGEIYYDSFKVKFGI